ncbi:class II fructose-bisphosphate aldolase [candidate division WWE3 bacterium]|uniref:Class II fructose-bisphosphate aldolase n=1 Tax=candidate division WWE3 bacterium TaxID=2053526 RepID=A0A7X9HGQ6_UNCKA|nr:class II fructose-bisphosphate aldolase [candidate division WWE3 bacterium]
MKTAFEILKQANDEHFALGAFNCANIETLKAITQAAANLKAPVILEASDGEINYMGYEQMVSLKRIYEKQVGIPIILNLDHGKDFDSCKRAIEAGFDYVHLDGGKMEFEDNVAMATEVVKLAHEHGIPVEGEMDHIEGSSADHTTEDPKNLQNEKLFTDPDRAEEFVRRTGIDVFASFIGNLHGLYADQKHLKMDLLTKIKEKLPNTWLSLHGGSGTDSNDVVNAIKLGIVKVNVNSELRIAFKMTLQEVLNASDEIAVYKIMDKPIKEVQRVVEGKIKLFGTAGKAA